jgi:glycosyltransferase involved in cell wall biosynthesis
MELARLGVHPLVFSIHDTRDEEIRNFPAELVERVVTLPQGEALVEEVKALKAADKLPQKVVLTLRNWGTKPDKRRVHEAAWIGYQLELAKVRHVHAHFAGLAARTCWWIHEFFDASYSFTGHANDILCPDSFAITRGMLVRDAARVVTVSDFTARHLREKYGAGRKVKRVYNGLDLQPISHGIGTVAKDEPPLILSVGRLTPKKGFGDLIAACGILRDRGTGFSCEIIGGGELEPVLARQIDQLGLAAQVKLLGPRDMETIIRRLHASTLFALACATEPDGGMDNLPTVLMEAMAAALPCVSTRLAGVPEMVVDGVTGLLVGEKDPLALANAIGELLSDAERGAAMGRAGLERARRLFAKETTTRELRRALVGGGKVRLSPVWLLQDPLLLAAKWLP